MSADQSADKEFRRQITLAVHSMIERYGNRAFVEAAVRADELEMAGNTESAEMWREIADVIHITSSSSPH